MNTLRISANGPRLQVFLNGTQICDVNDNPTDPAEAKWKEAGPISVQSPYTSGFEGFVKTGTSHPRALTHGRLRLARC